MLNWDSARAAACRSLAVEDGHRAIASLGHMVRMPAITTRAFLGIRFTVALPLTDLKIVFEYTVPGSPLGVLARYNPLAVLHSRIGSMRQLRKRS
jgi:hypothetical protein